MQDHPGSATGSGRVVDVLFRIDVTGKSATELPPTTLSGLRLRERYDLQEWVLRTPSLLGEDLLIITSEFAGFDKTAERLDVLALDKDGTVTVVELKRSASGTAAELQALRYAAYCSTLTLPDLAELMAQYQGRAGVEVTLADAEARIRAFVEQVELTTVSDRPRIILGAEDFSAEITATVLWLRKFGVDISCVRLSPYLVGDQLVLESAVLIPLPEAKEYEIRRELKEAVAPTGRARTAITAEMYLTGVPTVLRPLVDMLRQWLLEQPGVEEEAFQTLLAYKRQGGDKREWVTWLQCLRSEVRIALPPSSQLDPTLFARNSSSGWPLVRARNLEEAAQVLAMLEGATADGPTSTPSPPSTDLG